MKKNNFIILSFLVLTSCNAKIDSLEKINQTNTDGLKNGVFIIYNDSTRCIIISNYKKGLLHGRYKQYFDEGNLSISGKYLHGKKNGKWNYYSKSGAIISWQKYYNGIIGESKIGEINF